jgi:hypothetical protein
LRCRKTLGGMDASAVIELDPQAGDGVDSGICPPRVLRRCAVGMPEPQANMQVEAGRKAPQLVAELRAPCGAEPFAGSDPLRPKAVPCKLGKHHIAVYWGSGKSKSK